MLNTTKPFKVPPTRKSHTCNSQYYLFFLLFTLILSVVFFAILSSTNVAAASVPRSIESTVTVIGLRDRRFDVPTGTSRSQLISTLRSHYGTAAPDLRRFNLRIAGTNIRLTSAERNSLTRSRINFDHKADAILTASRNPNSRVNANRAILRGLNARAVDRIVDKYREQTRITRRDAAYRYNSRTRRIEVRPARNGRVAPRGDMRRAIRNAMVQFATQGYRGTVTTRNIRRSTISEPRVQRRDLGKIILVVRSERRLFLYNRGQIVQRHRVAVGRPGNSTPRGDFVIGAKRRNPTWGNPNRPWSRNMPQRIGPGPNNPLGIRAMNLNRANGSSTLLRIHGTSNTSSIGRAASAGCIRVANNQIVRLFNATPSGTRVWIR